MNWTMYAYIMRDCVRGSSRSFLKKKSFFFCRSFVFPLHFSAFVSLLFSTHSSSPHSLVRWTFKKDIKCISSWCILRHFLWTLSTTPSVCLSIYLSACPPVGTLVGRISVDRPACLALIKGHVNTWCICTFAYTNRRNPRAHTPARNRKNCVLA